VEHENLTCTFDHADSPVGPHHDKQRDERSGTPIAVVEDGGNDARCGSELQQTPNAQGAGKQSRNVMTCTTCTTQRFQVRRQTRILCCYAGRVTTSCTTPLTTPLRGVRLTAGEQAGRYLKK